MKVLFVCSGNNSSGISPIVLNQGNSLIKEGVELEYYTIKGKGFIGYLKSVFALKKYLKNKKFDIIHAHYFDSAVVPSLSFTKNYIVVSLMGSDVFVNIFNRFFIRIFNFFFWDKVIVKSDTLKVKSGLNDSAVIPNGVDLDKFELKPQIESKLKVGFDILKKQVLFVGNPDRFEKNYHLAEMAFKLIDYTNIELKVISNVNHNEIPYYLYAADVLILSSLWEGSPNIIKEALACNCPIISTKVGDIAWLFGNEPGHFLTSFEPEDVAKNIEKALLFVEEQGRTKGRKRLIELGLDSETIAKRIIEVYNKVLNSKCN